MKKQLANIITGLRIVCSLLILVFPAFSVWYYSLYITGGVTDVLDGAVARGLKTESDFGDKFDTIADITFSMAVFLKLVDLIIVPNWTLIWICVIILIKFSSIIVSLTAIHRFISIHSVLNKITGFYVYFMMFTLGIDIPWKIKYVLIIAACIISTLAAVHEAYCIFMGGPQNIDEAMDRVERMEVIFDKLGDLIYEADHNVIDDDLITRYKAFQPKVRELERYYSSRDWKNDFKLDEQGKFPQYFKKGVLSEDGLYNALDRNKELREKIGR
ncbi:MAG: DUF4298 domain-containing protein [Lachnospiraceae bacterium]|nr:DUF4298 domain-containing protein [Lachnospiraceae bacterium]